MENKFILAVIVALVIAIIDIVPMVVKKLPKFSIIASFIHFFVVSIVILNIDIPYIPWWIEGGCIVAVRGTTYLNDY